MDPHCHAGYRWRLRLLLLQLLLLPSAASFLPLLFCVAAAVVVAIVSVRLLRSYVLFSHQTYAYFGLVYVF